MKREGNNNARYSEEDDDFEDFEDCEEVPPKQNIKKVDVNPHYVTEEESPRPRKRQKKQGFERKREPKNKENVCEHEGRVTENVEDVTEDLHMFTVPTIQGEHDSWNAFDSYLTKYQDESYQLFRVRTSKTIRVHLRQRELKKNNNVWKHGIQDEGVAKSLEKQLGEFFSKKYICTHGWDIARKRGNNKVGQQVCRSTGCKAAFIAKIDQRGGVWKVYIFQANLQHNHQLNRIAYQYYAENRRVDDHVIRECKLYSNIGGSVHKIIQDLRHTSGKPVTAKDIHNILYRNKAKRELDEGDVHIRVRQVLEDFASIPGNICHVYKTEDDVASCISFQTLQMRKYMKVFPEILVIDATHGTNSSKYKFYSFMVQDGFGKGQFVQHNLVDAETSGNFTYAMKGFIEANPNVPKDTKVCIVDKDFISIEVLKKQLPDARVILCQVHATRYVHKLIAGRDKEYSFGFSEVQKSHFKLLFEKLVYSYTETEYKNALGLTLHDLGGDQSHPYYKYIMENWDNCKEMWTSYLRGDIPNLGMNITNSIEGSWGAFKPNLDDNMELDDTITGILVCEELRHDQYELKTVDVRRHTHADFDEHMQLLLDQVSYYAAELVSSQYLWACKNTRLYRIERQSGTTLVSTSKSSLDPTSVPYMVDESNCTCSCHFYMTRLLPCRHIIVCRLNDLDPRVSNQPIPYNTISPRWKFRGYQVIDDAVVVDDKTETNVYVHVIKEKKDELRFSHVHEITQRLASCISSYSEKYAVPMCEKIEEFIKIVKDGIVPNVSRPMVVPDVDEGCDATDDVAENVNVTEKAAESVTSDEGCDVTVNLKGGDDHMGDSTTNTSSTFFNISQPHKVKGNPQTRRRQMNDILYNKRYNRIQDLVTKFGHGLVSPTLRKVEELCNQVMGYEIWRLFNDVTIFSSPTKKVSYTVIDKPCDFADLNFVLDSDHVTKAIKKIHDFLARGPSTRQGGDPITLHQTEREREAKQKIVDLSGVECKEIPSNVKIIISGCGEFNLDQLYIMQAFHSNWVQLQNLKATVEWIAIQKWPETCPVIASSTNADILKTEYSPLDKISEVVDVLESADLSNGMLISGVAGKFFLSELLTIGRSEWWNDSAIYACGMMICGDRADVHFLDPCAWLADDPKRVQESIVRKLKHATGVALIPLWMGKCHWTALVIDFVKREIHCFDPLQSRSFYKLIASTVKFLTKSLDLQTYQVIYERSVVQPDGNSCGLYITIFFDRYINNSAWGQFNEQEIGFLRYVYLARLLLGYKAALRMDVDEEQPKPEEQHEEQSHEDQSHSESHEQPHQTSHSQEPYEETSHSESHTQLHREEFELCDQCQRHLDSPGECPCQFHRDFKYTPASDVSQEFSITQASLELLEEWSSQRASEQPNSTFIEFQKWSLSQDVSKEDISAAREEMAAARNEATWTVPTQFQSHDQDAEEDAKSWMLWKRFTESCDERARQRAEAESYAETLPQEKKPAELLNIRHEEMKKLQRWHEGCVERAFAEEKKRIQRIRADNEKRLQVQEKQREAAQRREQEKNRLEEEKSRLNEEKAQRRKARQAQEKMREEEENARRVEEERKDRLKEEERKAGVRLEDEKKARLRDEERKRITEETARLQEQELKHVKEEERKRVNDKKARLSEEEKKRNSQDISRRRKVRMEQKNQVRMEKEKQVPIEEQKYEEKIAKEYVRVEEESKRLKDEKKFLKEEEECDRLEAETARREGKVEFEFEQYSLGRKEQENAKRERKKILEAAEDAVANANRNRERASKDRELLPLVEKILEISSKANVVASRDIEGYNAMIEIMRLKGHDLSWSSTPDQFRKAFKVISLAVHPDKLPSIRSQASEAFQIVTTVHDEIQKTIAQWDYVCDGGSHVF